MFAYLSFPSISSRFNFNGDASQKQIKSDGKIALGAVEWSSFKVNIERAADLDSPCKADLNVKVRDILVVIGQANSVKRAGKASVKISFPKLPRDLSLESTFNLAAPRYDIRTELSYDAADPSKKIVVETKNECTRTRLDSDNSFEFGGDKWVVTIDGTRKGESFADSQVKGKAVLRLPSKREFVVDLDRTANGKAIPATANIKLIVSDNVEAGGKKSRSFTWAAALTDGNWKERLFNIAHNVDIVDFDGKNVKIEAIFSHLPKGHYKSGSAGITVKGALVPNTFDININVEEYCHMHAIYRITSKYGGSANFNVKGNYYVGERGIKPSTYELSADAAIPQSKLKSVKLATKGSYKRPAANDPNGQYDLSLNVAGSLNDKKLEIDIGGKVRTFSLTGHSMLHLLTHSFNCDID